MKTLFKTILTVNLLVLLVIHYSFAQSGEEANKSSVIEPMSEAEFNILREFYKYDKSVPLNYQLLGTKEFEHFTREKFVFTGHNRQNLSAYLAIPKAGTAPYPVVCVMHGGGSNKEYYWPDGLAHSGQIYQLAEELLKSGYAVLMLDARTYGERTGANNHDYSNPTNPGKEIKFRDIVIHSTIDYRRALDYLETRDDIDMTRVGTYGRSLGAIMSITLGSIDDRIKALIPFAVPTNIFDRSVWGMQQVEKTIAPWNYIHGLKDKPVFLVYSKIDPVNSPGDAQNIFKYLKGRRVISRTYDWECGHCTDGSESEFEEWFKWFTDNL